MTSTIANSLKCKFERLGKDLTMHRDEVSCVLYGNVKLYPETHWAHQAATYKDYEDAYNEYAQTGKPVMRRIGNMIFELEFKETTHEEPGNTRDTESKEDDQRLYWIQYMKEHVNDLFAVAPNRMSYLGGPDIFDSGYVARAIIGSSAYFFTKMAEAHVKEIWKIEFYHPTDLTELTEHPLKEYVSWADLIAEYEQTKDPVYRLVDRTVVKITFEGDAVQKYLAHQARITENSHYRYMATEETEE